MPFRSTPLYHRVTLACFTVVLVAVAAFIAVAEHRQRERQAAEEASRVSALLATVIESAVTTTGTVNDFDDIVQRVSSDITYPLQVVLPGDLVFGRLADGTQCQPLLAVNPCSGVLRTMPATRGLGNASGVVRTAIGDDSNTYAAYTAVPSIGGAVIVETQPADGAITGSVGVNAAAAAVAILAVYGTAVGACDALAGAASPGARVAGLILLHVVQFLPLAIVAGMLATADVLDGAAKEAALVETGRSASTVRAAVDSLETTAQRTAAVLALANFGSTALGSTSAAAGFWVNGASDSTPLSVFTGMPKATLRVAGLYGDLAIATGAIGPQRARFVYAARLADVSGTKSELTLFALPSTALLGLLAAIFVPKFTSGGSVLSRFDGFPHFVSPRTVGPLAATAALIAAALVPSAGMLQLAASVRDGAGGRAALVGDALALCESARGSAEYHLSLIGRAVYGPTGIYATAANRPSDIPTAVAAVEATYQSLATDRYEQQSIIAEFRDNASSLFTADAAQMLAMAAYSDAAYAAADALVDFEVALATHAWRGDLTQNTARLAEIRSRGDAAAADLAAQGLDGVASAVTAALVQTSARTIATRRSYLFASAMASTARDLAAQELPVAASTAALEAVDGKIREASSALRRAQSSTGHTAAAQREAASAMAGAGYAAITVVGLCLVAVVLVNGGLTAYRPALVALTATASLCFVVRALTNETYAGIDRYAEPSPAALLQSADWSAQCVPAARSLQCTALTLIRGLYGNLTVPSDDVGEGCDGADGSALLRVFGRMSLSSSSANAAVLSAIEASDAAHQVTLAAITADGCSGRAAAALHETRALTARARLAPFKMAAATTAASLSEAVAVRQLGVSTATSLTSLGCGTVVTANATTLAAALESEATYALGVVSGTTWATALSQQSAPATVASDVESSRKRLSDATDGHHEDALAWTTILSLWVAAAGGIYIHTSVRSAMLHKDNKDDFEDE